MKHRVIAGTELDGGLQREWVRIQEASRHLASPYFCPEMTSSVASAFADVRITVLEDGGRIVGFFPFHRGRLGSGAPIGGGLSDQHGVVVEPSAEWNVADLLTASGLSFWQYDHLLAAQTAFATHHRAIKASPVLDLGRGFDAWKERRRRAGARHVFEVERKARKLAREVGPLRFDPATKDGRVLERIVELKSEQCRRTGTVDFFARRAVRDVVERIVARDLPNFAGFVSALWAGDRLVAAQMGMRSSRIWHWWFPVYERDLGRYSPGGILLLRSAAHAASIGMHMLDLGKGDERYKDSFADAEVPLAEGCATRPSLGASIHGLASGVATLARAVPLLAPLRPTLRAAKRWVKLTSPAAGA